MKIKKCLATIFAVLFASVALTACASESNNDIMIGGSNAPSVSTDNTHDSATPTPTPPPVVVEVSVSDETQLRSAVALAGDTPTAIILNANIELLSDFIIPSGSDIRLSSAGSNTFNLAATRDMYAVTVESGATLTIDGISFTYVGLTLHRPVRNEGTFILNSGLIGGNGFGWCIRNTGDFVMNGGQIIGYGRGSAPIIHTMGTFSSFTMNGGEIIGVENFVQAWGRTFRPSGVQVSGSNFTMNGGTISGTVIGVEIGEGESPGSAGRFTMNNGTITNSEEVGVSLSRGTFTMYGGLISHNRSGISSNSTFTMNGGEVSYNQNDSDWDFLGGGVTISGGIFTMNGGTIRNNAVTRTNGVGGGVFMNTRSEFTMNGGWIFSNTAERDSDLHLAQGVTFNNNIFDTSQGAIGTGP